MRWLIGLYLAVGIGMLAVGFVATGDCADKNRDIVSDLAFVLEWPGYIYRDVMNGPMSSTQLLHQQACQGGAPIFWPSAPASTSPVPPTSK